MKIIKFYKSLLSIIFHAMLVIYNPFGSLSHALPLNNVKVKTWLSGEIEKSSRALSHFLGEAKGVFDKSRTVCVIRDENKVGLYNPINNIKQICIGYSYTEIKLSANLTSTAEIIKHLSNKTSDINFTPMCLGLSLSIDPEFSNFLFGDNYNRYFLNNKKLNNYYLASNEDSIDIQRIQNSKKVTTVKRFAYPCGE